ncbi:hypothetical protein [Chelativorans sp. J32]|uniref:hypothetical protein n=1 Tax=Chelativorans sp. J32 TaxID=935840 RepID=UPI0004AE3508|nr:hypothetical protein [Chelativorans sp. J32]
MTRLALLERLQQLQHMEKFKGRDITTISALLSNEALAQHVKVCEDAAGAPCRAARDEEDKEDGQTGARGRSI